jgi:hypothetical protein
VLHVTGGDASEPASLTVSEFEHATSAMKKRKRTAK